MIPRSIEPVIAELLADEPVVVLDGPRASGKSFTVRHVVDASGARFFDLDNVDHLRAVRDDPMTALRGPELVVVDEFQRAAEEVLGSIKAHLNRDGVTPGRYLLTGSTRADLIPELVDYLGGGRHHRITLLPFSQAELEGRSPMLMRRLFDDPASLLDHPGNPEDVPSYFGRVLAGGFPLAVEKTKETSRRRWFNNYVDDVCSRAAEVERVRGVRADATHDRVPSAAALMAVFRAAAGITAQLLNVAHIGRAAAAQLGLEAPPSWATVQRWLEILESVHLLVRIEAWGTTLRARTVRTPKVHVVDSGLAAHFVGVTSENLADPTKLTESGHLLETFVVAEILKELSLLEERPTVGHFRTDKGQEVDLVVELDDGRVYGVEVKRATRLEDKDLVGLRILADKVGDRFGGGVVIHPRPVPGSTSVKRVVAVPISALWAE